MRNNCSKKNGVFLPSVLISAFLMFILTSSTVSYGLTSSSGLFPNNVSNNKNYYHPTQLAYAEVEFEEGPGYSEEQSKKKQGKAVEEETDTIEGKSDEEQSKRERGTAVEEGTDTIDLGGVAGGSDNPPQKPTI